VSTATSSGGCARNWAQSCEGDETGQQVTGWAGIPSPSPIIASCVLVFAWFSMRNESRLNFDRAEGGRLRVTPMCDRIKDEASNEYKSILAIVLSLFVVQSR
jgi:hypothetical protein